MRARELSKRKTGSLRETNHGWPFLVTCLVILCAASANAQSSLPTGAGSASAGSVVEGSSSPNTSDVLEKGQGQASQTAARSGSIVGTTLDQSGSVAVGAVVQLTSEDKSFSQEVVSGDNGQFSFSNVPAGKFKISVTSA